MAFGSKKTRRRFSPGLSRTGRREASTPLARSTKVPESLEPFLERGIRSLRMTEAKVDSVWPTSLNVSSHIAWFLLVRGSAD